MRRRLCAGWQNPRASEKNQALPTPQKEMPRPGVRNRAPNSEAIHYQTVVAAFIFRKKLVGRDDNPHIQPIVFPGEVRFEAARILDEAIWIVYETDQVLAIGMDAVLLNVDCELLAD